MAAPQRRSVERAARTRGVSSKSRGHLKAVKTPTDNQTTLPMNMPLSDEGLVRQLDDLPSVVFKAVQNAREQIGQMIKTDTNEYANYKYAPIDAYYAQAIPIIQKNGLSIDAREIGCTTGDGNVLLYKFKGVLGYKDGRQFDIGDVTIPHRFDGPQTGGSAHSYADKVLMRRYFKIQTGEPDGDSQQQEKARGRPPVKQQRPSQADVDLMAEARHFAQQQPKEPPKPRLPKVPETAYNSEYDFTDYIGGARSVEELEALYHQAKGTINGFEPHDKTWVLDLFARKKAHINNGRASA